MSLQQAEEARLAVLPASDARPLWAAAAAVRAEGSFKCSACLSVCQCGTAAHARLAGRAEASAQGSVGGMATGAGAAAANAGAALSRRPCMLSKLFFTAGTRSQGTASRALLE